MSIITSYDMITVFLPLKAVILELAGLGVSESLGLFAMNLRGC
jgi:hypothetical protein